MLRRTFLKNSAIGIGTAAAIHGLGLKAHATTANMTITANSGAMQTLTGFGATEDIPANYSSLSSATRMGMANMVWANSGLGFNVCKLWNDTGTLTAAEMLSGYLQYYQDVNSIQPNMIWIYGAVAPDTITNLSTYAAGHAAVIAGCKSGGLVFQYTTTCNEPDGPDPYLYQPTDAANLVNDFRTALNAQGLQSVGIISPEIANVDTVGTEYIQTIINSSTALANLSAFAVHSGNMEMTPAYAALVAPTGKPTWQTEGDATGPEGTGPTGTNGLQCAAYFAANACSCLNVGAEVWMHFLAYEEYDSTDNATRILGWDPSTGDYTPPFLVYNYYQQMRIAFQNGCVFRNSTTNDDTESVFETMTLTYGDQPPIVAAAALNPNGMWGLNIVNLTGEPNTGSNPPADPGSANYAAATTYNITYYVEELANSGSITFDMYRSNESEQSYYEGTVIMTSGNVACQLAPMDLVTLVQVSSGGSSPTISLSPTNLTFSGAVGGSNPASQNVSVSNSGSGMLATPTTNTTYNSGSGWLSVQVQGSSAPFTLVNQTSISGLAAGTYTATVSVASLGATNTPQTYSVTLTVAAGTQITIGQTTVFATGDNGNGNLLCSQSASLGQSATLNSLSFYVTRASGKLVLGIYDASGPSGGPGALKATTSEFTPKTGWNTQNTTTNPVLPAGTYWLAYLPSSNTLAFVKTNTGYIDYYGYTFGTLPSTYSTSPSGGSGCNWSFYASLTT